MMLKLKFSQANAKTESLYDVADLKPYLEGKRKVYSFDLLSGWSCPGACDCLAKVINDMGKRKLVDGPKTKFRCFSASQEVVYTNTYKSRRHNFDVIKSMRKGAIYSRLEQDLPKNCGVLRWHVAGDFFKLEYLQAAIKLAESRPDVLFYGYTKSLHLLEKVDCLSLRDGRIRENFLITGSDGGKFDQKILSLGIRTAKVIFSESEAGFMPIDHDDSHAATVGGSFCLLLHGVQPKGSEAATALKELKGKGSYNRKAKV